MRWMPPAPPVDPSGWHSVDDILTAFRALYAAPLPAIDPPPADSEYYGIRVQDAFKDAYKRDHAALYEAAHEWQRIEHQEAREAGAPHRFRILHELAYLPVVATRRYLDLPPITAAEALVADLIDDELDPPAPDDPAPF